MKTRNGFTLVELIIVIAVIGILAAILIPTFSNVIDKANAKAALSDGRNTVTQYVTAFHDGHSDLPNDIVVFVRKAKGYYLYGFHMNGDGSIEIANGNPFKGFDSVNNLMVDYAWNNLVGEGGDLTPVPGHDYTLDEDATDEMKQSVFYLFPYDSDGNMKAAANQYRELSGELKDAGIDIIGAENDVLVYHGFLLGGNFTLDNSGAIEGGSKPFYTITFSKGELEGDSKASVPAPVKIQGGKTFSPNAYTATYQHNEGDPEWYVFEYWKEGSFVVAGNATVTAMWSKHETVKHTITFVVPDGTLDAPSGTYSGMEIPEGKSIASIINAASAKFTDTNMHLSGWDCSNGVFYAKGNAPADLIMGTQNMTFTAVAAENKYTATLDLNGGTLSGYTDGQSLGEYSRGGKFSLPAAPSKENKVFDYWKTSYAEDTTEYGATAQYTMPAQNVTIKAIYKSKFDVTFYDYKGTVEIPTAKVTAGEKITLPETTTVSKPNTQIKDNEGNVIGETEYQFVGWACNVDGAVYTGKYTVEQDTVFTATFLDIPKFWVTFSAGELAGNSNVTGMPANFLAKPTTNVNVNTLSTPSYNWPGSGAKYVFDHWDPSSFVMAEDTIVVTAVWSKIETHKVEFVLGTDGKTLNLATLSGWTNGGYLDAGKDITALVDGSTASTDKDMEFFGWNYNGKIYEHGEGETIVVSSSVDMTFTAVFKANNYTVKYKAGEGTGSDYTQGTDFTLNQSISLATVNVAGFTAPSGKVFSRWQSSISGESEMNYKQGASYTVTQNVTFTAIWITDPGQDVNVTLYDTWNQNNAKVITVHVASMNATKVELSEVPTSDIPDNWAFASTASSATITTGAPGSAKFDGTFLVKPSGSGYTNYVEKGAKKDYTQSTDCYQVITTQTGLNNVANRLAGNYRLDKTGLTRTDRLVSSYNEGQYTGVFDGNNNSITLNINNTAKNYVGFISYLNGGTVKNLKINVAQLQTGGYSGAVAGCNDHGIIENCTVTGSSPVDCYSREGVIGGLVGHNDGGTIRNCTANIQVYGLGYTGGLVGMNEADGRIEHCTHSGYVQTDYQAEDYCGGFVGENDGTIIDCHHTSGNVKSNGCQMTGGFVGVNLGTIDWCSVRGNIDVTSTTVIVGGFAGQNGTGGKIEHSYCEVNKVTGPTATTNTCVGGFCGRSYGPISNCYARNAAVITGCKYITGFTTMMNSSAVCTNCYNYPKGSLSYGTSFNLVAFDYYLYATATRSNCYVITTSTATSYIKSTKATSDSALITAAKANSSWVNAGCWDFTGSYAKLKTWEDMYGTSTVKFVSNISGVSNPSDKEGEYGQNFTMPTLTAPSASWQFLGWSESATATTATYTAGQSMTFAGDKTYYGVWNCTDKFSITFAAGKSGATGTPSNITNIAYNANVTLPSTVPTCAGDEVCIGWKDQNGTTYAPGSTITGVKSNLTLTGQWQGVIHITCQADMQAIDTAAEMTYSYVVDNDFTITSTSFVCGWLSSGDTSFKGVFDGQGHKITVNHDNLAGDHYGLFTMNEGTIKNLTVAYRSSNATNSKYIGGAIVGANFPTGIIENCDVQISDLTGMYSVGGVAGTNEGMIRDCHVTISEGIYATGSVTYDSSYTGSMIGGVVGYNYASGKIICCSANGNIQGYTNSRTSGGYVGGIVGWNKGTVDQCWFVGSLNNEYSNGYGGNYIGGIAGRAIGTSSSITNCYTYINYINGYDYESGIAGAGAGTISCCVALVEDGGTYNGYSLDPIAMGVSYTYCYWDGALCDSANATFGTTTPLAGLSTSIWEFEDGCYPGLINNPCNA